MLTVGRWRILIDQFEAPAKSSSQSFRSASGQTSPDFGKRAKRASDNGTNIYLIASISASTAAVGPPLRLLRSVALRAGSRSNKATTAGIDIARILRRYCETPAVRALFALVRRRAVPDGARSLAVAVIPARATAHTAHTNRGRRSTLGPPRTPPECKVRTRCARLAPSASYPSGRETGPETPPCNNSCHAPAGDRCRAAQAATLLGIQQRSFVSPLRLTTEFVAVHNRQVGASVHEDAWALPRPAEFHTRLLPWRMMYARLVGPCLLGRHNGAVLTMRCAEKPRQRTERAARGARRLADNAFDLRTSLAVKIRICAGFRTPAVTTPPHVRAAGV
jgi:hypothetical protein